MAGCCPYRKTKQVLLFLGLLCYALFFQGVRLFSQQVYINELMASNASTIADEDGDYSDWIELFNHGKEAINLQGFGLSDNYGNPFKWVFPYTQLAAGKHIIIWASGKNRASPFGPLHTNFSISSAGEEVLITRSDGTRLDEVYSPHMPADISYGRNPDGGSLWLFYNVPTPGNTNWTEGYQGFLAAPQISIHPQAQGGFLIEFTHNDPLASVHYTTNGSSPSSQSALYQWPVYIENFPFDSLMFIQTTPDEGHPHGFGWNAPLGCFPKALVVRAKAYREGYLSSNIAAKTHFEEVPDFPVISIATDFHHLFSDTTGIYVPGDFYNENGFGDDFYGFPNANYFQEGDAWERPASIELLYPDGSYHSQLVGLRIHGSRTRAIPMKSLRVYARSEYGNNTLDFDLFGDGKTGYKRFLLRNSGQDFFINTTMFRDAAIQNMLEGLRFGRQRQKPAIVYINGEFWGIHNIRDRLDKYYLAMNYGVDPENVDMLKEYWSVVEEGDATHYQQTLAYIDANGLSDQEHYDSVQRRMDVDSFIDYQISNIFANNNDWPGNNIRYWRLRTNSYQPNAPYGHDGRWRWLLFDTDFGFGLQEGFDAAAFNMLEFASTNEGTSWANPPEATFLLRKFLENQDFTQRFINRYADLLNSWFLPHRTIAILDQMTQYNSEMMHLHINRYHYPESYGNWLDNIAVMRYFAQHRPAYQWQHLREKFSLGADANLTLDVSDPSHGHVRINTLDINEQTPGVGNTPYPWIGTYFQGVEIQLQAIPKTGYVFVGWEGLPEGSDAIVNFVPSQENMFIRAVFSEYIPEERQLMYYWHFNQLPSGSISQILADSTIMPGANITYQGSSNGYMDRVSDGTSINAIPEALPGYALRVRNPSDNRQLLLQIPTTGFRDIRLSYAVKRTANGQQIQKVFYRPNPTSAWIQVGDELLISEDYQLFTFDMAHDENVNNQAEMAVMITFHGTQSAGNEGNNRFDNIRVEGNLWVGSLPIAAADIRFNVFPNPTDEKLWIDIETKKPSPVMLHLVSMMGQTIESWRFDTSDGGRVNRFLDLSNIRSGTYLLRLTTPNTSMSRRIVIVR